MGCGRCPPPGPRLPSPSRALETALYECADGVDQREKHASPKAVTFSFIETRARSAC